MPQSRRTFLASASAAGMVTVMPFRVTAAGHESHVFETSLGAITVHPISHASLVLETPVGTIYVDPVGEIEQYSGLPAADLILVTHEHGDHFSVDTLAALMADNLATPLISNPAVREKLTKNLSGMASVLANGDSTTFADMSIEAIPAYNITEGREQFHPEGRDNGYILTIGDFRIYISGDTEDIPEMRALTDIDLCFLCMNLPFTMDVAAAASAVQEFQPTYVYPYHYRGRDNGTQDPNEFTALVGESAIVKLGEWY